MNAQAGEADGRALLDRQYYERQFIVMRKGRIVDEFVGERKSATAIMAAITLGKAA